MFAALRRSAAAGHRRAPLLLLRPLPCSSLVSPAPLPSSQPAAAAASPLLPSCRAFHASAPAGFRASDVLRAPEFAVADYFDDDRVAPKKPGFVSAAAGDVDQGLEIAKLGIDGEIVSALAAKGITKLFPIQQAVLQPAMQGRDLIARAKTGTGKTLAFGIPMMDKIIRYNNKHGRGRYPLGLVLAPTRELAKQVDNEFQSSAPNLDTICVYGGTSISYQMNRIDAGIDIIVGTPGRIIDLINRGTLNLSQVQHFVLDEADQMLAVGFAEDVEKILNRLPQKRQGMMFSATMPSWIRNLTNQHLRDHLTIDLVGENDKKLAEGISLYSIASSPNERASILGPLVTEHAKGGKCIIFTQTKRDADQLSRAMGRTHQCEPLHGDISQSQRERTLSGFREGRFNILIATDVAARGLDIPNVDLVIHFELPSTSEIFVHRSGRTGRAGKKGIAILIYLDHQIRNVQTIERDVSCKFVELPKIKGDPGLMNMRFGYDSGGFGRASGFGNSNNGYSGNRGFGGGQSFGNRSSFGRSDGGMRGGRDDSRYASFGTPGRGNGFGGGGGGGGGGSGRYGGFGDSSSGRSGGYGNFGGGGGGGSGFGNTGGFGDTFSKGGSGSSRYGSFGNKS